MRVGVIYLGRRGAGGPISLELATHLAEHAQVFAVLSDQVESMPAWQRTRLPQMYIPTYRNISQALLSYFRKSHFRHIAGQIRELSPDVLLFPMFYTWNPFLQAHLPEIPSVVAVHDPQPHPGAADRIYRRLEDRSIRQASRCVVFSASLTGHLQARGAPPDRIDVVPHGGLDYYQMFSSRPQTVSASQPALLFFGRITPYKGLEVLLKAWRQVHETLPVRLLIVGEGDLRPYRTLLKGLPRVDITNRWVGDAEVDVYFSQAYAVVLPYTSASQSGVAAIAASYGLPVIATRTGGIPEQIRDGATGLLVEPGSVEQLGAALQRLVIDPVLAERLGANLKNDFASQRSWAHTAELVYAACRKAAGIPQMEAAAAHSPDGDAHA